MSDGSKISWLDRPGTKPASWNPIRAARIAREPDAAPGDFATISRIGVHCEHASEGCRHCYAEGRWNMRFGTQLPFTRQSRDQVDIYIDEKILTQPLHWTRPRTIFVCSTSDLFGEWVPDEMIDRVIAIAALCPRHTFIVLTKRADRMRAYFASKRDQNETVGAALKIQEISGLDLWSHFACDGAEFFFNTIPLPNLWLGVTAENQEMADKRIPDLLATPAAVRFVSCEPMLGEIDLRPYLWASSSIDNPTPFPMVSGPRSGEAIAPAELLHWVICGGESGAKARPMHPDWARSLRDQCVVAGAPFFFKQWGEWMPSDCATDEQADMPGEVAYITLEGQVHDGSGGVDFFHDDTQTARIGRAAAGDMLDGERLHAWPEQGKNPA